MRCQTISWSIVSYPCARMFRKATIRGVSPGWSAVAGSARRIRECSCLQSPVTDLEREEARGVQVSASRQWFSCQPLRGA